MESTSRLKSVTATLPNEEADFLHKVGRRVRELREERTLTRRSLAVRADVSERYLGQLETGEGNVSIMRLRRLAVALNVEISEFFLESESDQFEQRSVRRFLRQIPRHRLPEILTRLEREVGSVRETRRNRIALIGLRGAGKSTLGAQLAQELQVPFVEMDREIEAESGLPLSELFSLYGQAGYRRFEGRCLARIVKEHPRAVLSVGGGVVSEADTYDFLLANCFTVWLSASPSEHMQRVIAQGDMRPMAESHEAMEDLKRILAVREPQYRKADEIVDTSGLSVEASFVRLRDMVSKP
ncbi:MAG TPA: helix-turn-helix transcriptional regulator [Steroidobacteraceae bacterium]|jgi:XRE family aerobic/anaerobic benzoate catabolism transcriptional regulator|nr:helix-turn-helix transcriptional regulator [Steroidobacteraceae bacterium]